MKEMSLCEAVCEEHEAVTCAWMCITARDGTGHMQMCAHIHVPHTFIILHTLVTERAYGLRTYRGMNCNKHLATRVFKYANAFVFKCRIALKDWAVCFNNCLTVLVAED